MGAELAAPTANDAFEVAVLVRDFGRFANLPFECLPQALNSFPKSSICSLYGTRIHNIHCEPPEENCQDEDRVRAEEIPGKSLVFRLLFGKGGVHITAEAEEYDACFDHECCRHRNNGAVFA